MRIDSARITGSIRGSEAFAQLSGSFTGSFLGTASWAENAITASYALNAGSSFPFTGSADISGSFSVDGPSVLDGVTAGGHIVPEAAATYNLGSPSASFQHLYLSTASLHFVENDGTLIETLSATADGISGSFVGDGSGLTGIISSSYAVSASSIEARDIENLDSFLQNEEFLKSTNSASFFISASTNNGTNGQITFTNGDGTTETVTLDAVDTASLATTASYVEVAQTASYISSSAIFGSIESASYALTASTVHVQREVGAIENSVGAIPLVNLGGGVAERDYASHLWTAGHAAASEFRYSTLTNTLFVPNINIGQTGVITGGIFTGSIHATNGIVSGSEQIEEFGFTTQVISTSSFNAFSASINAFSASINGFTSSIQSEVDTIQTFTSSIQGEVDAIQTFTSSIQGEVDAIQTFTSSIQSEVNALQAVTGGYALTSSISGAFSLNGTGVHSGSEQVVAALEGQSLNLNVVSASIYHEVYTTQSINKGSGSFAFGDTLDDTHTFTGSVLITGSIEVEGDFSASYATTASHALTASFVSSDFTIPTASHALTASHVITSSHSITTVTANSASFATTSSHAVSASHALNADEAISSSFATTASHALLAESAETASFVTGSNVYGPHGSNSILSASFALTASYVDGMIVETASFVTSSNVHGPNGADSVLTSSFAISASHAQTVAIPGVKVHNFSSVTSTTFTHGIGRQEVFVQCYDNTGANPQMIIPAEITLDSVNALTVEFAETTTGYIVVLG